jgi:hypothetical protein
MEPMQFDLSNQEVALSISFINDLWNDEHQLRSIYDQIANNEKDFPEDYLSFVKMCIDIDNDYRINTRIPCPRQAYSGYWWLFASSFFCLLSIPFMWTDLSDRKSWRWLLLLGPLGATVLLIRLTGRFSFMSKMTVAFSSLFFILWVIPLDFQRISWRNATACLCLLSNYCC